MIARLFALAAFFFATPVMAQEDVAAFYRGKQVRLVVGTAPGGLYDLAARIVSRHIGVHIPGQPTVVVQNLPAAGGLVMTNQLYAQGPKDGTVIGVPINGIPTMPLIQPAGVQFDANRLIWLGSTNREPYVAFVWHTAPVQSLDELKHKALLVGSTTPGTTMSDFPAVVNDVLGLKFKVVQGYQSTPQINHAIERGEIQGQGGIGWAAVKAQVPHWIRDRKIRVIAQYGLKRHPDLAGVPSMLELAASGSDRQALTLLVGAHGIWPAVFPAARRARSKGAGVTTRLRCYDEGAGFHRRCGQAAARDRSNDRRAGAGAGGATLPRVAGDRGARARGAGGGAGGALAQRLFDLDPNLLNDLAARLRLRSHEGSERIRTVADRWLDAGREEPVAHVLHRHDLLDRGMQPVDDLLWRAGRRDHALPDAEIEAGEGFGENGSSGASESRLVPVSAMILIFLSR